MRRLFQCPRLSLRTMLVLVTLACCTLGVFAWLEACRKQYEAAEAYLESEGIAVGIHSRVSEDWQHIIPPYYWIKKTGMGIRDTAPPITSEHSYTKIEPNDTLMAAFADKDRSAKIADAIRVLPKLYIFDISGVMPSQPVWESLGSHDAIKFAFLRDIEINRSHLVHLGNVTSLDIDDCQLAQSISLSDFARLERLEELYLSGLCNDEQLALEVNDFSLKMLHLHPLNDESKLTDQGVRSLKKLTQLEYLSIPGEGITDRSIETIASMKSLKRVQSGLSGMTPAGKTKLKQLRPDIEFKPPLIQKIVSSQVLEDPFDGIFGDSASDSGEVTDDDAE